MSRIFISYRRSDSITITGRLHDRLVIEFDDEAVFKDVDDIPLGADFRTVLDQEVGRCSVQLVIIGPDWLDAADNDGQRRLDDPDDFVRIEVEAGLRRDEVLVIPVLVKGAGMPSSADLPLSLRELVFRNAAIIRDDPDFHRDMSRLIHQIRQHMDPSQAPAETPPPPEPVKATPPPPSPKKRSSRSAPRTQRPSGRKLPWMWAVVALVFLVLMAVFIGSRGDNGDDGNGANGDNDLDGTTEGMVVATEAEGLIMAVALDAENPDDNVDIARGVELAHHLRDVVYIDEKEVSWEVYEAEAACSDGSVTLAEGFVEESRVIGVVGHACNDGCNNTIPIYEDAGYTTISPACANPDLIQSGGGRSFLRTIPPDVPSEGLIAEFVRNNLGHHSTATIHGMDDYSIAQVEEFSRQFTAMDGGVISLAIYTPDDVYQVLDQLNEHYVESVYYTGDVEFAAMLLTEGHLLQNNNTTLILGDGSQKHEFAELVGGDPGIDVYATYPEGLQWDDAPEELLRSYMDLHGNAPQSTYAFAAFSAANMFLDAVEENGTVGEDGTIWIPRDAIQDFLNNYDADSPAGYLRCGDNNGDCLPVPLTIYQMAGDGSFDRVEFR